MNKIKYYLLELTKQDRINFVLLLMVFLFSSLILFIPMYYLIAIIFAIIIVIIFFYRPELALYSFVLSVPLIRPNFYYLHFQDIFIVLCFITLAINLATRRYPWVKLRTKLDAWIIILLVLFSIKGFGSIEFERGSLHALRFFEAIMLYYMVVYFIRAQKIKITLLIKLLIVTSVFQGLLGPIQSIFNNFGVQEYANNRGYFGYLGIGPTEVYSGRGTFWHFAAYGYYLVSICALLLPFYRIIIKRKIFFQLVLLSLFAGIIFSYSRGALGFLILLVAYYWFIVENQKTKVLLKLTLLVILIAPFVVYFALNPEYLLSLNLRNSLWDFHLKYLSENINELIWGAGFESRESTFYFYAPKYLRHPGDINPHNLILAYVEEIGLVGFTIYLSFWIKVLVDTFKNIKNNTTLMKTFNLGLQLVIISFFMSGVYDHVYHDPYLVMFLFFLIGIAYAKGNKSDRKITF